MKTMLSSILLSFALSTIPAWSQSISIVSPADQTSVKAGSNITIQINRPDFASDPNEIGIVVGLANCFDVNEACSPPQSFLGTVLYNGPFNPVPPTDDNGPPRQFIPVTIPDFLGTGRHQLAVWHFSLVGASAEPLSEFKNITLNLF